MYAGNDITEKKRTYRRIFSTRFLYNNDDFAQHKIMTGQNTDKTIMVVEDDRTHRALMDKILQSHQFKTIHAENGAVALSKIDAGQPCDLILMDWDMPELNGLQTVKALRARETEHQTKHIPVIGFTANRKPGDREICLAAGMDAYLPKDVWMPKWQQTLADTLQNFMNGDFDVSDLGDTSENDIKTSINLDDFDNDSLEEIASLLKDELSVAIDEYLEDAAAYIHDIKQGFDNNDLDQIAKASHPLKSNSKSFGLIAVSQLAESINDLARQKEDRTEFQPLLPQLEDAFKRAKTKLNHFINRDNDS